MRNAECGMRNRTTAAGTDQALSSRDSAFRTPHSAFDLRAIDVDLHHQITDWRAVAPYAPAGLRHRVARKGGPPLARHGFKFVGERFGDAPLPSADAASAHPAADPR